jgi:hypothetical protein
MRTEVKILVCGSRDWTNRAIIRQRVAAIPAGFTILHGAARGADTIAREEAEGVGLKTIAFPAEWEKYGRAAGPIRNRAMLDEHPDLVIAFHNDISRSRGTADTVREAKKRGIPVEIIKE